MWELHLTDETHWWAYDGVYSDRRDAAEHTAFFFFCQTGVETKISERKKREGSETCGSSERRMNNSQNAQSPRVGWISRRGGGGEDEKRAEQEVDLWWLARTWAGQQKGDRGLLRRWGGNRMLLWSERWWVVVEGRVVPQQQQQQQRRPFRLLHIPGEKGERGSLPHLLSLCVPSAFSPTVCSSPPRLPPSPLAARERWKTKSTGNELDEKSWRLAVAFSRTGSTMNLKQVVGHVNASNLSNPIKNVVDCEFQIHRLHGH